MLNVERANHGYSCSGSVASAPCARAYSSVAASCFVLIRCAAPLTRSRFHIRNPNGPNRDAGHARTTQRAARGWIARCSRGTVAA